MESLHGWLLARYMVYMQCSNEMTDHETPKDLGTGTGTGMVVSRRG
jgi:hypothetical protein